MRVRAYNVNGISTNAQKRNSLGNAIVDESPDGFFLIDMRFRQNQQAITLQGHDTFHATNQEEAGNASRGVTFVVNQKKEIQVVKVTQWEDGNALFVESIVQDVKHLFIGIYGPNKDNPEFYKRLMETIQSMNYILWSIHGDINLVLNPKMDSLNYVNADRVNPRARAVVNGWLGDELAVDSFRHLNYTSKKFSWKEWNRQGRVRRKAARLDLCLVSTAMMSYVKDSIILRSLSNDLDHQTLKEEEEAGDAPHSWSWRKHIAME